MGLYLGAKSQLPHTRSSDGSELGVRGLFVESRLVLQTIQERFRCDVRRPVDDPDAEVHFGQFFSKAFRSLTY